MKYSHRTETPTENGITIAERDRIDMMIQGMSKAYQERALMNFDSKLLVNEAKRRYDSYHDSLDEIEKVYLKYRNKPLNIVTMKKTITEYRKAVENIKK